jgi:hypothetical protein
MAAFLFIFLFHSKIKNRHSSIHAFATAPSSIHGIRNPDWRRVSAT